MNFATLNSNTTNLINPNITEDDQPTEEELIPCENFTMVSKGVYRSSFPKKKNFPFLKKLGLGSVM